MAAFSRYIGIDYSGAETPEASLKGLRVYSGSVAMAIRDPTIRRLNRRIGKPSSLLYFAFRRWHSSSNRPHGLMMPTMPGNPGR
jgi:hypothetical protein